MSKKLLKIYKDFQSKWVALNAEKNEVLASGSNIKEVEDVLKKKKQSAYEIRYILPLDKRFAPSCQS